MLIDTAFETAGFAVGLLTVMLAVPEAASKFVGTEAEINVFPNAKEPVSGVPFHRITEPDVNPVPFRLSVAATAPTANCVGDAEVMTGVAEGAATVRGAIALLAVGGGFATITLSLPAVAWSATVN
jgi:hypothetical protein